MPYIIFHWYPPVNPVKTDCDDIPFQEMIIKDGYSQTSKLAIGVNRRLAQVRNGTVITDHDLRRQKKTDDRILLSMGKHRPMATQMSRSLTGQR